MPPRKKTAATPPTPERVVLTVGRENLAQQIDQRTAKGQDLIQRLGQVTTRQAFEALQGESYSWSEFNHELLRRSANTDELADECRGMSFSFGESSPQTSAEDVQREVRRLKSIKDRLPLIEEAGAAKSANLSKPAGTGAGREVFIVHGQRESLKLSVARFCQQGTAREAVILHEQPSSGQTVIEKFERHASDAGFAVVLLTADDTGGASGGEHRPRGRQNVIFEAGFFIGALGRSRVAILYESGVELPSDLSGVIWIAADEAGAWKYLLAKEMRAAGIDVDMNAVL